MNNNKFNSRIMSNNVQLGKSFVLGQNQKTKEEEKEEKERREFTQSLEQLHLEAKNKADAIIKEAEEKAAEIINKADAYVLSKTEEIENLKMQSIENGYAEGFQKGCEEGINKAKQEVLDRVEELDILTKSAYNVKKEIINSSEKEILDLSIAIAEKILRQELAVKPELIQEIIKAAIEQLNDKEEIKIIVNPVLISSLYDFTEKLKETVRGLKNIKIIEDKTIPKDGVIVESPESRIDARIETQLREIVKNIMTEFAQKSISEPIPKEIEARIEDNKRKKS